MTATLNIAAHLSLPLDFVTKTAAILAQRRKGKTYTASVIAEEMVAVKQPFVALDPTGAWWGLRASADAKGDGLPVVVLGGQHGDVPLERTGGRLIADLVVEEPGYYVIDFSLFESGEAERQFAVDFAERLYRAKGQPGRDFPLHLFVDEADRFIPQQMRKGSNETSPRLLGAFEAIVRRGGLRGLGTTLISQRAAVVNKNVLEMLDVLIVLRTLGPNDQAAILDYVKAHGDERIRKEMMGSLASLDLGEAWIWEPGAEPSLFERVHIRKRHTFNSSATPKPGEKRIEPKRLAAVDLAALEKRMAATVEKAKADDPALLRKRIQILEGDLRKKGTPAAPIDPAMEQKRIDRAILAETTELNKRIAAMTRASGKCVADMRRLLTSLEASLVTMEGVALDAVAAVPKQARSLVLPVEIHRGNINNGTSGNRVKTGLTSVSKHPADFPEDVSTPHQRILDAIAWQESLGVMHPSATAVAMLAKYAPKSGGYRNLKSELRVKGWIDYPSAGSIALTEAGRALANVPAGEVSDEEVQRRVYETLSEPQRRVLTPLISAWPQPMPSGDVATAANYEAGSGGFRNLKSELRVLGVVDYPSTGMMKASDLLFPVSAR